MKRRLSVIFLSLSILFSVSLFNTQKASAQLAVFELGGNLITNIITTIEQTIGTIENTISAIADDGMWTNDMMDRYMLPVLKQAAIEMMHSMVSEIVGSGNNGKPAFVTDWNEYLYTVPQKEATVYLNSFFNSVSAGRVSGLNYEGAGQNYDKYLKKQAEQAIFGNSSQNTTTIQNYTSDPKEMFSSGNFKAFSSFLSCPNNPYCYSMMAQEAYQSKLAQTKEVNQYLANNNAGYVSKVVDGKVVTPGSQYKSAMEGVDQLANNYIVNATNYEELISGVVSTLIKQATNSLIQGISKS